MKKIILITMLFFSCYSHSSTSPSGGGGWSNKTVTKVSVLDNVIEATARKQVTQNGSKITLEAVVQETIDRRKVGGVLLKRLLGGGILIGATQSLVNGVGWIMEEGAYVKYKVPEDDCATSKCEEYEYVWHNGNDGIYNSYHQAPAQRLFELSKKSNPNVESLGSYRVINVNQVKYGTQLKVGGYRDDIITVHRIKNTNYDPSKKKDPIKIVLTDELLGNLAVGDYTDPTGVPAYDKKDDVWTGVEDAYKPDPTGTGNELSDSIDKKFDDAPTSDSKPDGKPSPDGKPHKYPAPDSKPGTEGTVKPETNPDGTPKTDADGNPTGESKFQLPAFCDWASIVCEWIQWTKEEEELKDTPLEIEEQAPVSYQHQDHIRFGQSCPFYPETAVLPMGILGEIKFQKDLTFICDWGLIARPYIVGLGYLGSLMFLLYGIRNGNA